MKQQYICIFVFMSMVISPAWCADSSQPLENVRFSAAEDDPVTGTNLYWQAVKLMSRQPSDPNYLITIRTIVPDTKACYAKGPLMDDYVAGEWYPWLNAWDIRFFQESIDQLAQHGLGQWTLKFIHNDDRESIYTFTISGSLQDTDFLPVPEILEPADNASGIIAQDYLMRWNPNDAHLNAHLLILEITGQEFSYLQSMVFFEDDLSITQWYPGWLEPGSAFAKLGYALVRSQMLQDLNLLSGPPIAWDTTTVFLVSADKTDFTVKYSLDFNEDGIIDLADLAIPFSHWLERR